MPSEEGGGEGQSESSDAFVQWLCWYTALLIRC